MPKREVDNLNDLRHEAKNKHKCENVSVTFYFDNIKTELLNYIESAHSVVGCVAWITDWDILDALTRRPGGVALIQHNEKYGVGKGQFASARQNRAWSKRLKIVTNSLPSLNSIPLCLRERPLSAAIRQNVPILRVGSGVKRMHHKFIIFVDELGKATGVWNGSFNFSKAAAQSLENACVYNDERIANVFLDEFLQVYTIASNFQRIKK